MMTEKQFIESQKECASMIGMSLGEYQKYCENLKIPKQVLNEDIEEIEYDNDILNFLGLTPEDLKVKKGNKCQLKLKNHN